MGRKKYFKGPPITDWNTLLAQKCVFVPFGKEPIIKNMAFVQNLQLRMVANMLKSGQIYYAIPVALLDTIREAPAELEDGGGNGENSDEVQA